MKPVGWEIRPLGWLLLILIGCLLTYLVITWLQRPPHQPEHKT